MSDYVRGGVAGESILEGKLCTITLSGVRAELPVARIATSGTVYPIFVAIAPPDNFQRPTNATQYTAPWYTTIRRDVNTGWGDPVDSYTLYRQGLSTLEAPTLTSGMLVQLHRGCTVTVTDGCFITGDAIKVPGALVKVADDDTGKFEVTVDTTIAIGYTEEYDSTRNYLTVTLKQ